MPACIHATIYGGLHNKFLLIYFSVIPKALRDRTSEIESLMATITNKETAAGYQWNFDMSSSWFFMIENSFWRSRGVYKEEASSQVNAVDYRFGIAGVEKWSDGLLKHEIGLLFFPAQPLVTPDLVAKIKENLSKEE